MHKFAMLFSKTPNKIFQGSQQILENQKGLLRRQRARGQREGGCVRAFMVRGLGEHEVQARRRFRDADSFDRIMDALSDNKSS